MEARKKSKKTRKQSKKTARQQLKDWREARSLSQRETGKLLGVTQNFIGMLERGERMPGLVFANKVKLFTGIKQEHWEISEPGAPAADPGD